MTRPTQVWENHLSACNHRRIRFGFVSILCLLLFACGGSGGGGFAAVEGGFAYDADDFADQADPTSEEDSSPEDDF